MSMDEKLVERKITLINRDLGHLRILAGFTVEQYLSKEENETLAERYLERIIGRMIDINYHILVEEERVMPLDYHDSFIEMGKKEYVPVKLSEKLAHAAGLRNRLAHEYDEIDEKKVYQAVQSCMEDVPEYLTEIIKFIESGNTQGRLV